MLRENLNTATRSEQMMTHTRLFDPTSFDDDIDLQTPGDRTSRGYAGKASQ